jgi:hypothetical protein
MLANFGCGVSGHTPTCSETFECSEIVDDEERSFSQLLCRFLGGGLSLSLPFCAVSSSSALISIAFLVVDPLLAGGMVSCDCVEFGRIWLPREG